MLLGVATIVTQILENGRNFTNKVQISCAWLYPFEVTCNKNCTMFSVWKCWCAPTT